MPSGIGVIAEHPFIAGRSTFSFAQSEWFIKAKESHHVVMGTPYISGVNGVLLMPMAKSIRDNNGDVLGILAAPIYLNSPGFMDYIFDENHRQQGDVLVVSRDDAIFVASSDPAVLLKPITFLAEHKFYDAAMSGFNGFDKLTLSSGDKMLNAAADINNPNWFVVVRAPIETVYKRLNDNFYSAIVNGVLVSLVALLTITFTLYLFFIPLRKTAKSVKKMIENPDTLAHIDIYKNDEIGRLIKGFNLLIDIVNERNTNLIIANAALESLSQTDGLTGIANRRYFDETLRHAWRVQTRNQQPLTLLLIDIDDFKKYNDTYGHIAGDDCLKNVTQAIKTSVNRPTDFFARYGGEEFVILLQGNMKEGTIVAEKARVAVSKLQIEHRSSSYKHLTISLGIASVIPNVNRDPFELIKKADKGLYQSKAHGKNRYEVVHDD
ncbi:two-component system, cell cycle response regulator [Pseudoalteromonas sp. BSi20652]|uniref:sensor domain-containing diguanylate cyclase n=1 Tax=Pseudoalteromonas sp. BSi20652 TaxID=388384 RepID=UPI0002318090|nr:diguanylate cyclase [Pseudoalteromonas sp. BSi20652]GAA59313.1 two-component system, cell cycle response regulator [Pseudoalteromonas sp. BSi20652]